MYKTLACYRNKSRDLFIMVQTHQKWLESPGLDYGPFGRLLLLLMSKRACANVRAFFSLYPMPMAGRRRLGVPGGVRLIVSTILDVVICCAYLLDLSCDYNENSTARNTCTARNKNENRTLWFYLVLYYFLTVAPSSHCRKPSLIKIYNNNYITSYIIRVLLTHRLLSPLFSSRWRTPYTATA